MQDVQDSAFDGLRKMIARPPPKVYNPSSFSKRGLTSVMSGAIGAGRWRLGIRCFQPVWIVAIATVAVLTYAPFLDLPPLPDDYLQVELGEAYGAPGDWWKLAMDPLYRCRATSILLTGLSLQLFGFTETALNWTSLILHALNCVLVYLLGSVKWIGWRVSAVAAIVFAVRQRHHEAVVWYAALPELLVFLFGLLTVLAWLRWLETDSRRWLVLAAMTFVLALGSKESSVALSAALPLLTFFYPHRRRASLLPSLCFVGAGIAYFLASYLAKGQNHHYADGTFSLQANFVLTLLNSMARDVWVWGGLSLLVFVVVRMRHLPRVLAFAAVWSLLALLPYSFLTYMPRVPSRHHYLASISVSLLIATAFWLVERRWIRVAPALLVLLVMLFLGHNWLYLWLWKKPQFVERAAPVEQYLHTVERRIQAGESNFCADAPMQELRRAVKLRLGVDCSSRLH